MRKALYTQEWAEIHRSPGAEVMGAFVGNQRPRAIQILSRKRESRGEQQDRWEGKRSLFCTTLQPGSILSIASPLPPKGKKR